MKYKIIEGKCNVGCTKVDKVMDKDDIKFHSNGNEICISAWGVDIWNGGREMDGKSGMRV